MSAPADTGARVRSLAARLNDSVVSGGRSLSGLESEDRALSERDQSLLRALLNESIRWHHRYQWQIDRMLDRPLKRRDTILAALLRIGLTQLDALRIPDHAAVSATVAASSELGLSHARGMINAVLRRYLRERESLEQAVSQEEIARFSHPQWLITRLKNDWPDDWQAILEANNQPPPFWLRVNRRQGTRESYLELLSREGLAAAADARSADAVLLSEPCAVSQLPGFQQGRVSVQDVGAQYAAELLQLAPGMRVLDACAAPGGKTGHILEHCPNLDELVAVDNDSGRLELVASNLRRLQLSATLIAADVGDTHQWFSGRQFDRILLDAPCSATGVIRRHPDIKVLRRASDIAPLAARQAGLVRALWPLLRPGGRMVYVSCSVLKAENQALVADFVLHTADAALSPYGSPGHLQILPGEANRDGFYYACVTKTGGGIS